MSLTRLLRCAYFFGIILIAGRRCVSCGLFSSSSSFLLLICSLTAAGGFFTLFFSEKKTSRNKPECELRKDRTVFFSEVWLTGGGAREKKRLEKRRRVYQTRQKDACRYKKDRTYTPCVRTKRGKRNRRPDTASLFLTLNVVGWLINSSQPKARSPHVPIQTYPSVHISPSIYRCTRTIRQRDRRVFPSHITVGGTLYANPVRRGSPRSGGEEEPRLQQRRKGRI